jgi:hypothetical protein
MKTDHGIYYYWRVRKREAPSNALWCAELYEHNPNPYEDSRQVGKTWGFRTWREAISWVTDY